MIRMIAAWGLILAWGLSAPAASFAAGGLAHVKNFRTDGALAAKRRVPIMVLFTTPTCPYCDIVKRDYLVPMHKDRAYRPRVLIRELTVNSDAALTGFDGKPTTEAAFAAAAKVFVVPTVMVFDPRGEPVGEPIVGLLIPDFYFGYLEAAIEDGLARTRAK
ncbi:MAG: thioredoxin fold domain-containing protein [Pseudomonadota bacterium]|jgi:thioredoxin-related protein